MTELQQKMIDFLEDTVQYYSVDPIKRRSISDTKGCFYSPKNAHKPSSNGCAIGRHLPEELQGKYDSVSSCSISYIYTVYYNELPVNLKELPCEFLRDVQHLHDAGINWNGMGLSLTGEKNVQKIKNYISNYND